VRARRRRAGHQRPIRNSPIALRGVCPDRDRAPRSPRSSCGSTWVRSRRRARCLCDRGVRVGADHRLPLPLGLATPTAILVAPARRPSTDPDPERRGAGAARQRAYRVARQDRTITEGKPTVTHIVTARSRTARRSARPTSSMGGVRRAALRASARPRGSQGREDKQVSLLGVEKFAAMEGGACADRGPPHHRGDLVAPCARAPASSSARWARTPIGCGAGRSPIIVVVNNTVYPSSDLRSDQADVQDRG